MDELIRRIQLDKAARNLRSAPLSSSHFAELAGSLPPTWRWIRLGDAVINRDGERVPVSREERATRAKTYPYYGASGVIDQIDGFLFEKPLLLIGEDGANLINRSTPIAFIARGKYWVNNHAHVLDAISEGLLRYIELYINAVDLRPYVTGTAQPKLNQARMNSIPIALPPEPEQHCIVAKVDELTALCDELEAAQVEREARRGQLRATSLRNIAPPDDSKASARFFLRHSKRMITKPDHVAEARQVILDLAVRGRLVPQDPNDEPASEWLRELDGFSRAAPHADSANGRHGILPTRYPVPQGWVWAQLAQVFAVTGGIQKQPKRAPKDNAWPYLGVSNVQRGRLDLRTVARFELFPGELERLRLEPGDLLVVEGNGSPTEIGRCARWNGEIPDCVHQNHIIRCRPLLSGLEHFALLYVNSPSGTATMRELAITSAGLYSLSVGKIQRIAVPIPPLAEQRRIVAKVDELMAVCDELELALAREQTERGRLLEALLHDALDQ